MRFFQIKEGATGVRLRMPVLDTMLLSAVVHPHHEDHSIEGIASRVGVNITGRHTALGDAIVTGELFLKLIPLLADKGIRTLGGGGGGVQGDVPGKGKVLTCIEERNCLVDPLIGRTITHYRILERLGEGGMGVVYKAEDDQLRRTVALKFLPPGMGSDPGANARFMHEAQAASALDHPNICTIHEIGRTDEGQLFICMAFYEGETLKKKIERGPLKIPETLEIVTQVARGLARAHERGITHRDIKPANILLAGRRAGQDRRFRSRQAERAIRDHKRRIDAREQSIICPPSRCGESRPMRGRISGRSAWSCTRWSPDGVRSRGSTKKPCSMQY